MRDDPPPPVSPDKAPHDKFKELGAKLMRVPKAEVDAREKKWQQARKHHKRR